MAVGKCLPVSYGLSPERVVIPWVEYALCQEKAGAVIAESWVRGQQIGFLHAVFLDHARSNPQGFPEEHRTRLLPRIPNDLERAGRLALVWH